MIKFSTISLLAFDSVPQRLSIGKRVNFMFFFPSFLYRLNLTNGVKPICYCAYPKTRKLLSLFVRQCSFLSSIIDIHSIVYIHIGYNLLIHFDVWIRKFCTFNVALRIEDQNMLHSVVLIEFHHVLFLRMCLIFYSAFFYTKPLILDNERKTHLCTLFLCSFVTHTKNRIFWISSVFDDSPEVTGWPMDWNVCHTSIEDYFGQ